MSLLFNTSIHDLRFSIYEQIDQIRQERIRRRNAGTVRAARVTFKFQNRVVVRRFIANVFDSILKKIELIKREQLFYRSGQLLTLRTKRMRLTVVKFNQRDWIKSISHQEKLISSLTTVPLCAPVQGTKKFFTHHCFGSILNVMFLFGNRCSTSCI